jgi:hypothetical protein
MGLDDHLDDEPDVRCGYCGTPISPEWVEDDNPAVCGDAACLAAARADQRCLT